MVTFHLMVQPFSVDQSHQKLGVDRMNGTWGQTRRPFEQRPRSPSGRNGIAVAIVTDRTIICAACLGILIA